MARYAVKTIRTERSGSVGFFADLDYYDVRESLRVPVPTDLNVGEKVTLEVTKTEE